jgi:hypothetical protein
MSAEDLLNSSDEQLKTLAAAADGAQLNEIFDGIWAGIRSANH